MGLISPCGYNQDFQPLKMSNRPLGKLQPVNIHSPKMRAVNSLFFILCVYICIYACLYVYAYDRVISKFYQLYIDLFNPGDKDRLKTITDCFSSHNIILYFQFTIRVLLLNIPSAALFQHG